MPERGPQLRMLTDAASGRRVLYEPGNPRGWIKTDPEHVWRPQVVNDLP